MTRSAPIWRIGVDQRLGAEIARRRHIEILAEVVGDLPLGLIAVGLLGAVALQLSIRQRPNGIPSPMWPSTIASRGCSSNRPEPISRKRMHRGLVAERPGRAHEPGMAGIETRVARQRAARMQIERHVEPLDRRPERPVLRQVVVDRVVGIADLREAVDQRALEAELLDRALKLFDRARRGPASAARPAP